MGNSTPKELNELGRTTVNAWTEQRQWAHRFYVHDVVKNWMLERFQEKNYNYDLKYDLVSFCASKTYRDTFPNGPNIILKIVDMIKQTCFKNAQDKNIFYNYDKNKWKLFFICQWNAKYTMTAGAQWMDDDKQHVCYIDVAEKFFCPEGQPMPREFSLYLDDDVPNMFGLLYQQKRLRNRPEKVFIDKNNWNFYDENLMALIILLEHEMVHALLEGLYTGLDAKSGTPEGREDDEWDEMHQRLFCTLSERMFGHKEINSSIGELENSEEYQAYKKDILRKRQQHIYNLRSKDLKPKEALVLSTKIILKF